MVLSHSQNYLWCFDTPLQVLQYWQLRNARFSVSKHCKLMFRVVLSVFRNTEFLQYTRSSSNDVANGVVRSNGNDVANGVVLGSNLEPLLFTFYVYDLPVACPECSSELYADNSKVYKIITRPYNRNSHQLSHDKLVIWTKLWELDLSYAKYFTYK